jgi:hypothetical protein
MRRGEKELPRVVMGESDEKQMTGKCDARG